jgi:hypothetical protein
VCKPLNNGMMCSCLAGRLRACCMHVHIDHPSGVVLVVTNKCASYTCHIYTLAGVVCGWDQRCAGQKACGASQQHVDPSGRRGQVNTYT